MPTEYFTIFHDRPRFLTQIVHTEAKHQNVKEVGTCLNLRARVLGAVIDDHLVYFAKLAKVVRLLQDLGIGETGRQPHHKHQILLHHSHVGQVLAVLRDAELLGLVLLALLGLDFGNLLAGERLKVGGVLCVGLPTGGTETVALRAQLVPTESANLKKERNNIAD